MSDQPTEEKSVERGSGPWIQLWSRDYRNFLAFNDEYGTILAVCKSCFSSVSADFFQDHKEWHYRLENM